MFELKGLNYIVTGGAQGIGFAVTRAISEMGGNVAVMDIQEKPVPEFETLQGIFNNKTLYIRTDVTKQESLNASFEQALKELGTIDGLVPAAGIAIDKPFLEQTWEEFTRIQEINVSHEHKLSMRTSADRTGEGTRNFLHCPVSGEAPGRTGIRGQYGALSIPISPYHSTRVPNGSLQRFERWYPDAIESPGG